MTDAFVERLRRALAPEFVVERVLGAGGMGIVVLAREVALDRLVAVKTIRPERSTALAVERFLREAQTLAGLSHPNIVPIHRHEMRDGLPCIVMAYLDGESLRARLERGPLATHDVVRLGRDLLAALAAAHARGVIHRDIKPANIFLQPGRAVLADFGIAKTPATSGDSLTVPGDAVGTPAYMSPEQAMGRAEPVSDLFALGLVLYEAATGRSWPLITDPAAADWSGVPRPLAATLQRVLALPPGDRWPDAESFRRALRARRRGSWAPGLAAAALVVAIVLARILPPRGPPARPLADVAIVPFTDAVGVPPGLGLDLAVVAGVVLRPLGDRLALAPTGEVLVGSSPAPRAAHLVDGQLVREGGTLVLHLRVRDRTGGTIGQRRIPGDPRDRWTFGEAIALSIVDIVRPGLAPDPAESGCRPARVESLEAWLTGEEAFRRDDWRAAEIQFQRAVTLDPGFCTAEFRLWLVQRWRRIPITVDLERLIGQAGGRLPAVDRLLIEAELAPTRAERRAKYEDAVRRDPFAGHAPLQYGAELMHRGPLDGIPLDSGIVLLREAIRRDSSLAPAYDQLVWGLVRLGQRDAARAALDALERHTPDAAVREIPPAAFEIAYAARFLPERLEASLPAPGTDGAAGLPRLVRLGLSFDVAPAQALIGGAIAARVQLPPPARAHGHVARGLALLALGRPAEGLEHLDSAAAVMPDLALQAAQWRVLGPHFGIPGIPPEQVADARAALHGLLADARVGPRARWTLALSAAASDPAAARRLGADLETAAPALHVLVDAVVDAAADPRERITRTERLRGIREETHALGDGFARAILHLKRAEWFDAARDPRAAERERRWHENTDFEGWLQGAIQAAEVDWVVGAYVRFSEAVRRVDSGDATGCVELERLLALWAEAEPAVRVASMRGAGLLAERCA